MVYSKLANFLHSIDLCTDVESLVRQYELIRNEYDLACYEADGNILIAESDYHDAYMKALWSVMQMFEIRIKELGGQLPGYAA